jgi:hypothetical protein
MAAKQIQRNPAAAVGKGGGVFCRKYKKTGAIPGKILKKSLTKEK